MEVLLNKLNNIKQKPVLVYSMGCLLLFAVSFLFTYYLRVIYSPAWMSQIKWSLIIFGFFFALAVCWFVAVKLKNKNMPLFMAILLFVLGMVWVYATPPNQVPDEYTHYLRSYQMAQGQWGFDEKHVFPDDVNSFVKHFPTAHNNGYPAKEGNTVYNRFLEYYDAVEIVLGENDNGTITFYVSEKMLIKSK